MSIRSISFVGVVVFLAAVFCTGFVFFYHRIQRSQLQARDPSRSLIDKDFPHAQLVDINGLKVDEQILRKGRIVVVFITTDCDACTLESRFLRTLVDRRRDVTFYGLVPFGKRPDATDIAEREFPFQVFYDESNSFVYTMGINRVPVKVFLEDGIIRKGWIGAAITDQAKTSFTQWLDTLP